MVSTLDDGGRRMLSDALAFWLSGRGSARAEDARGTPTQSHISPSILEYTKIDDNGQARALCSWPVGSLHLVAPFLCGSWVLSVVKLGSARYSRTGRRFGTGASWPATGCASSFWTLLFGSFGFCFMALWTLLCLSTCEILAT